MVEVVRCDDGMFKDGSSSSQYLFKLVVVVVVVVVVVAVCVVGDILFDPPMVS